MIGSRFGMLCKSTAQWSEPERTARMERVECKSVVPRNCWALHDWPVPFVLDGRLLTKRYGSRFIASLPDPTVRKGSVRQLPELAALWLADEPLPPEAERSPDESWLIPPPEEPPWWD